MFWVSTFGPTRLIKIIDFFFYHFFMHSSLLNILLKRKKSHLCILILFSLLNIIYYKSDVFLLLSFISFLFEDSLLFYFVQNFQVNSHIHTVEYLHNSFISKLSFQFAISSGSSIVVVVIRNMH